VKVFVPWPLANTVGEWNFCEPAREHGSPDPLKLLDEHWIAADYLAGRDDYWKRPTWPLTLENAQPDSFKNGPLEDWTKGALHINPATKTFARLPDADLKKPFTTKLATQHIHGKPADKKDFTFEGKELRSPEIHDASFIIELVAKFNSKDGTVLSKRMKDGAGYVLKFNNGGLMFELANNTGLSGFGNAPVADGKWYHIIIEANRNAARGEVTMNVFPIGQNAALPHIQTHSDSSFAGNLANNADLLLGAEDPAESADFEIDFLRIALSTLAESRTTAAELHAWQFNGPQHRDMRGVAPKGKARDAGALECW
jgi:hypothetical protein